MESSNLVETCVFQGYHRICGLGGRLLAASRQIMTASDTPNAARIRENLIRVRENIAAAAARAGRDPTQILLVGVTKYVEPEIARLLAEAGVRHLGESRPQELWKKADSLGDLGISWHLIGHLQRNKVKKTIELNAVIHSADSLRLLEEIDNHAANNPLPVSDVLLEVNVSGDAAKHGLRPDEVKPLIDQVANLKHVAMIGLMAMSGFDSTPEQKRREFAALRELRDKLGLMYGNVVLNELSMGMSDDYEIAIEEGATIVRIGSALFEGVKD
jgi:pyridoxal phosphate enzyme (YggS family)